MRKIKNIEFANFNDFNSNDFLRKYRNLSKFSNYYLSLLEKNNFLKNLIGWPIDSLSTNTRAWEYTKILEYFNNIREEKSILDIGGGITFFPFFLNNLKHKVTVIDNDKKLINLANKISKRIKKQLKPPTYKFADIVKDKPKKKFDLITCISVIEHLKYDDLNKAFNYFYNSVKKGGKIIITLDIIKNYNINNYNNKIKNFQPLTNQKLISLIKIQKKKFRLLKIKKNTNFKEITNENYPISILLNNYKFKKMSLIKIIKFLIARYIFSKLNIKLFYKKPKVIWTSVFFVLQK